MGKFTVEKWRCDRCGLIADKRPPHPGIRVQVRASEDYETAGGPKFEWLEMCNACNTDVRQQLDDMAAGAEKVRVNHAR